jgi:hypothetical protein
MIDVRTVLLALLAFTTTFAGGWWFGLGPKTFALSSRAQQSAPVSAAARTEEQQSSSSRIVVVLPSGARAATAAPAAPAAQPAAARPAAAVSDRPAGTKSKGFRLRRR